MAEILIPQGIAVNPVNGLRLRLGHNVETLAGSKTLLPQDAQVQLLDPDSVERTITLPAEEASQGLFFFIRNSGSTNDLKIENDAAGPIMDIAKKQYSLLVCDGSSWTNLGIVEVA